MANPRRIYRLLLKLYPARFREEFGGPLERQFQDDYRDARGWGAKTWFWLHALADLGFSIPAELWRELRQDVAYAARIHRQRPAVTALTLASLALAIGVTTGVFSVVNALLLRSLPFREPDRLVQLRGPAVGSASSRSLLMDWAARSPYLADMATYQSSEMNLAMRQSVVRVAVGETSAGFFSVLGAEPEIGRAFASDEDLPGRDAVAVIGHALWQQSFGSDARVLGAKIQLNGVPLTVIGVAPAGVDFPGHAALWTPTAYDFDLLPRLGVVVPRQIGRLKPGVSLAQASRMFETEARIANPEAFKENEQMRPQLSSLRSQIAGRVGEASLVLMGVVVFVLLIACSNVAHLLLSRVTERQQELTMRAVLGASRARLVQQLITECTLLTLGAAAAGMLVAYGASRLAVSAQPAQLAAQSYTVLDWRVMSFAAALAVLTGLVFGVLPATLIGRLQPSGAAVRSQSGGRGSGAGRMRSFLVAMQAAFTLVLLSGALTMGRAFLKITGSDLGFRTANAVTMNVSMAGTPRENTPGEFYNEVLERLRAIPGVVAAGGADSLPLTADMVFMGGRFHSDGASENRMGALLSATPGYFQAMGTPILQGREFTAADHKAAIVSDSFARQFPGVNLIGRRLVAVSPYKKSLTVVGIVQSEHWIPGQGGGPQVFVPVADSTPDRLTFVVRVKGRTEAYLPICRDAVLGVNAGVAVFNLKTLDQRLTESLAKPRFYTTAILFFGVFALLLAVTGIYGVANFSIVRRMHEIGVRMAVGASPERLRASLLRQSLAPVAAGAIAGAAGAIAAGRAVAHLMEYADPVGPPACALAALALGITAALAIWMASKRIIRLDPMRVLRAD